MLASSAFAQTPTASVVGRVTDASGAVLPGVTVIITNPDTNRPTEAVTNGQGDYTILFLNPARYVLEATLSGFRTYKRSEFTLAVEQTLRLDVGMELGGVAETVNVTEAAPMLNTETATRGDVTTKAEIAELPLADRSFANLAFLTGSVTPQDRRRRRGVRRQRRAGRQCRVPARRHEQHAAAQHQRPDEPVG
jgi:hypothetical protein